MSQELSWTSFDPETGTADGSLSLPAGDGPLPVVALLAGDDEEAGGWAPRAALALVRGWAREGGRIVLADLGLEAPSLHALLGEDNGEGITDAVLYGASVQRVAGRPSGERFILIPAGTPVVDPETVLVHPRWKTLIAGFQEAGAVLALYLPTSLPGARALAEQCSFRVQVGGEGGWEGSADLRLRPAFPLPADMGEGEETGEPGDTEEGVESPAATGWEETGDTEEPVEVASGEWDEPGTGAEEPPPPATHEAVPAPAPPPARLAPAPVPREIPRPRMLPGIGAAPEPEATQDAEPGDALGSAEPAADASLPHEPIPWEEADPWDLPELQPAQTASPDPEPRGEDGATDDWDILEGPDLVESDGDALDGWSSAASGTAPQEFEPHGIPDGELEQPLDPGSGSGAAEYEPHGILDGELEVPEVEVSWPTEERGPHEITEDELAVLSGSDPQEGDLEPHGVLDEPQGRTPPEAEDGGADPFGFLGEWGGDREEEGSAPDGPLESGDDDGAGSGWGEPLSPWEAEDRSWDSPGGPVEEDTPTWVPEPEYAISPEPDPAPLEMADPLPPEAPAAWSPPSGADEPEAAPPVVSAGPARRPPPPPRQERATGAWLLFLLLLAVAVLLGAARFGFIQIPGVTPQQGDSPLQPGLGATSTAEAASIEEVPAPADDLLLAVEPTSPVHALALALTAFGSAAGARAAAERLRPAIPGHPVMVVPVESGGQLFHRLMVGGARNFEEVEELRVEVTPFYSGSPPSEWIVREADRAFLLAETASQAEAERRLPDLLERGIPAYILEVPLTDGARLWRVYAGAYGSDQEAAALAGLLREAGESSATLAPLTGRPPG